MALGKREQRLLKKLTSEGLLESPDLSLRPIPKYHAPDLSKIKLNMGDIPVAPAPPTDSQDFANYLLLSTSADKKTARMFGNSLATREGAKTEGMSFLSKLFDTLDTTSDLGINTVKNIGGIFTDGDGQNAYENMQNVVEGVAGAGLKIANDTVLKPTRWLADALGHEEYGETMDKWEDKLLPDQEGSQVLKELGVKNKFIQGFGGLALDIAFDPLTYVGFGAARLGKGVKDATDILDLKAAASGSAEAFAKRGPKPKAPSVAEDALSGNAIPNLNFQVPKIPHVQVGTPLMDEAQSAIRFSPKTRKLRRKLLKAQEKGAGTKGQQLVPDWQELTPNPTRTLTEKLKRRDMDFQRAMIQAGKVAEGTKFSVRAANEVASRIARGEVPRVIPVPKAPEPIAQKAREVADDFIDDLMGPKRTPKGRFQKRETILEVNPAQQIRLLTKVGQATNTGIDEGAISALRAAEDQMIALGVQPVWHNGIRVRLSDVLQSFTSLEAVKSKQVMSLNDVLSDFIKKDVSKMNPDMRMIIHALSAQRSMNVADIVQNVSAYASKAAADLPANYMGRQLAAANAALSETAVGHAIKMGMTNKEAQAIKDLVKDIINVDKLPADRWLEAASSALMKAVNEGRVDAKLVDKFNKKVAESIGVTSKNLHEKISGNRVADAIMTRMTTWWAKGPLHRDATAIFRWGERNAEVRAETMRKYAMNYSKAEIDTAWKIIVGDIGMTEDKRILELSEFMKRYFEEVFRGPKVSGMAMANAATQHLSVAERSMTMMEDVNRHLKAMGHSFQFTKSRQVTRVRDGNKVVRRYNEGSDWMRSWELNDPTDPLKFIYDLDLALERTTKEYAFLDDFVAKFGSLTKDAHHNFAMPNARIKGFYVPEEVGRQIIRIMDDIEKGAWRPGGKPLQYYQKALRIWKTGVTIYLPSHHIRNGIGDLHLMWWAGHNNPMVFAKAKRVMSAQRHKYKMAVKAGDFDTIRGLTDPQEFEAAKYAATAGDDVIVNRNGIQLTADDLYTSAFQRGLLIDANRLEDIFGESTINIKPLGGVGHSMATQAAEYREHFIRLSHYISAVEKGLKKSKNLKQVMDEAAFEVKKWHPDGTDLTQFEQKYMRNIVPFYSWLRKSTPLLFETLMTRPAKLLAYPRGMVALQESFGIDASLTDPFPNDQLFPEWLRGYGIGPIGDPQSDNPFSRWWGLLGRNVIGIDGQPLGYTMFNPSTPFIDAGQQFGGFGPKDTAAGLLESITPFAKVPIDLAKNSDFTGAPITKDEGGQGVLRYLMQQIPGAGPIQRITDFGDKERDGVEKGPLDHEALINMLTAAGLRGTGPYIKGAEFEAKERAKRAREGK